MIYFAMIPDERRGSMKKVSAAGCALWIAGLIVFITGLNLTGNAKEWMTVAGSIVFLAGLGITGAIWMKKKKEENTD